MTEEASQFTEDPAVTAPNDPNNNNPVDDEGLLLPLPDGAGGGYDVVLCGTGLVQSILASALSRAGCRVLHVDGNDQYGELETVWTLPYLLSRRQQQHTPKNNHDKYNNDDPRPHESWHREFRTDTLEEDEEDEQEVAEMKLPLHREGMLHSLKFHSMNRSAFPVTRNSFVQTAYGRGYVETLEPRDDDYHRLVIALVVAQRQQRSTATTTTNNRPAFLHPKLYVGIPNSKIYISKENDNDTDTATITIDEQYLYQNHQIRTVPAEIAARVLDSKSLSRLWALDVTPHLLYCTGPAVSGLLTSGVADYCEFKSLEGLLYLQSSSSSSQAQSQEQQQQQELVFSRVPCSKNDVFASPLLSPMDKRRLMKFLQTTLDYATAEQLAQEADAVALAATTATTADANNADSLQSWNERHLLQGRSLSRPQNKAVAKNDLRHLQELCRQSSGNNNKTSDADEAPSFEQYLRQDQKLSPSLTALVRHALALEQTTSDRATTTTTSVADGMKRLCAHLLALGRFGNTAFLVPLYGSGELSQAFCRSAAVYGATYLLRRPPTAIVLSLQQQQQNNSTLQYPPDDSPSSSSCSRTVEGIVLHGPHDLEQVPDSTSDSDATTKTAGIMRTKRIPCRHVVVPYGALRRKQQQRRSSCQRVLRRISILCGKPWLMDEDDNNNGQQQQQQQRSLLIVPPHVLGPEQNSTIHGLLLDEGANVAPYVPDGCSVLHLTMTISVDDDNDEDDGDDPNKKNAIGERVLEDALQAVLQQHRRRRQQQQQQQQQSHEKSGASLQSVPVEEIFHVTFSYDIDPPAGTSSTGGSDENENDDTATDARGLHVIHRPCPGVAADDAFEVAASIFAKICPDQEFLKMSPAVDEKVKETLGDLAEEVDEENLVLKSAVGMIELASPKDEEADVNEASANERKAA